MKATGISRATVTWTKREQKRLQEVFELCDAVSAFSCTSLFIAQKCPLVSDVTMSCDCHMVIPNNIASIVVVLVLMHGERWLA